jgi:predicted nucleic acid-binding protein
VSFVIDASVAAKWFFQESDHEAAKRLLARDLPLFAPDIIIAEVTNILWKRLSAGAIDREQAGEVLAALPGMFQQVFTSEELSTRALYWSQRLDRPALDAFYVACAEITGCHLVSVDHFLRVAGANAGIAILTVAEANARLEAV